MENFIYEQASSDTPKLSRDNIEAALLEKGFRVLTEVVVHEVMASKGIDFNKEIFILGVCNPNYAKKALETDENIAVFLPCTITVHNRDGGSLVKLAKSAALVNLFPDSGLEELGREVEEILTGAINEAIKK